jgi:sulfatase modifying factor 1
MTSPNEGDPRQPAPEGAPGPDDGGTRISRRPPAAPTPAPAPAEAAAPAPAPMPGKAGPDTKILGKDAKRQTAPAAGVPAGVVPRKPSKGPLVLKVLLLIALAGGALVWWKLQNQEAPPPRVKITFPDEGTITRSADVVVRGAAKDLGPTDKIQVQGLDVPLLDGKFERTVTLTTEGEQKITATVVTGGTTQTVLARASVTVKYQAAWRTILEDVPGLFKKQDWEGLRAKFVAARAAGAEEKDLPSDAREGLADHDRSVKEAADKAAAEAKAAQEKYDAPPTLTIDKPADEFVTDKATVRVEGAFSSGRPSDVVKVDGKVVPIEAGRYRTDVTFTDTVTREINVVVEDGGTVRKHLSVTVTYNRPKAVWEDFLAGWAIPKGTAVDPKSGFPLLIQRAKDHATMALVPAGPFWMGSVPNSKTVMGDEQPGRTVTLSKGFYVDLKEVTVGQWRAFVASGEGKMPNLAILNTKDDFPVYNVNHFEATAYARWAGVMLPTEAQWEKAARGGHDDWVFPWGAEDDPKKRNAEGSNDEFEKLAPVGSFPANGYGLFDMGGNVWEWVADWYDPKYYWNAPAVDPMGPAEGKQRVLKGGAYDRDGRACRCSGRYPVDPISPSTSYGFRCAKTLP